MDMGCSVFSNTGGGLGFTPVPAAAAWPFLARASASLCLAALVLLYSENPTRTSPSPRYGSSIPRYASLLDAPPR